MQMMFRRLLPPVGTLILLAIVFSSVNIQAVYEQLLTVDMRMLSAIIIFVILGHVLAAMRWRVFLVEAGITAGFLHIFIIYLGNIPLARWIPLYAGDLMRVYLLRKKIEPNKGAAIIFAEATLDLGVLLLMSFVGCIILKNYFLSGVVLTCFFGLAILASALRMGLLSKIFKWKQIQRFEGNTIFSPKIWFYGTCLTTGMWAMVICGTIYSFGANGVVAPISAVILFQPLVVLLSLLPVTFGGLGVREAAMVFLYSGLGTAELVTASGLTYSMVSLILVPALVLPLSWKIWRGAIGEIN